MATLIVASIVAGGTIVMAVANVALIVITRQYVRQTADTVAELRAQREQLREQWDEARREDALKHDREVQSVTCAVRIELEQILVMIDPTKAEAESNSGDHFRQAMQLPCEAWQESYRHPAAFIDEQRQKLHAIYADVELANGFARTYVAGADSGTSRSAIAGRRRVLLKPISTKIESALASF